MRVTSIYDNYGWQYHRSRQERELEVLRLRKTSRSASVLSMAIKKFACSKEMVKAQKLAGNVIENIMK